jgi:hypothetical protein
VIPPIIKETKVFVLIVVKPAACLPNDPNREYGKNLWRQYLEGLGALLADLMNRVFNLADNFQVKRIVKNTPILQKEQEAAHSVRIRRTGVGPLNSSKRCTDARDPPRGLSRDLSNPPKSAHQFVTLRII